jgi:hypothetical protein
VSPSLAAVWRPWFVFLLDWSMAVLNVQEALDN